MITDIAVERELALALIDRLAKISTVHFDAWSGKPFLQSSKTIFYSVGQNQKDDHGDNDDLVANPKFKKSKVAPSI